jgi:CheY-like chemotaxis protein
LRSHPPSIEGDRITASSPLPSGLGQAEAIPAGKVGGRLASEILELFAGGAFSFWHWVPVNNILTTHGNLTADSLEEWMMRIHPRDQSDFLRFIDREWKCGEAPSFIEYRFNADRQGDWIRVRHTASCIPCGEQSVLSCLIESLPLTKDSETPLEKMEDELKGTEVELLRFVESALDLRIQADPVPRLELLQRAIGADVMVLVHFGSRIVVTDSLPLSRDESTTPDSELHIPLIEALASMDPADQTRQFELDLPGRATDVTHFIVSPIHWGEGFKGALCAGYRRKENRRGDQGATARLSLISAFSDGQLGRLQKLRAREEILERFKKVTFGNEVESASHTTPPETVNLIPAVPLRRVALEEATLKGATILLVEDEVAVRKLVRKLLEMLGCSVIEASSGREALSLWPDIFDRVALVVSDIVMPEGVSGWDLAKELHLNHPDLGILLTSGYDELPEEHGLHGRPQIAFLQKPYEVRTLKNTLSRLISLAPDAA